MKNSLPYMCDRGLASRIHQELKITKHQENKLPDKKNDPRNSMESSPKRELKCLISNLNAQCP